MSQKTTSRPPRGKGTDRVYLALRNQIVRMELRPGQKIDENEIVKSLGVSRTPVREAIIRLSGDKLVDVLTNRGARVAPLDILELSQYFEALELTTRATHHWASLRRTEKSLALIDRARLAYEKAADAKEPFAMSEANLDFHHAISEASGNQLYSEIVFKLSVLGMRIGWIWYRDIADDRKAIEVKRTIKEHRLIQAAIKERNAEEAERLAKIHIDAFREQVFLRLSHTLGSAIPVEMPDSSKK
ncbi:MAG: GntR family transcriptional regulator [Alphaproteobacteria bacterium]|nr:GntR family transcriptional regulator [Alphaproteobacteria bacterium]